MEMMETQTSTPDLWNMDRVYLQNSTASLPTSRTKESTHTPRSPLANKSIPTEPVYLSSSTPSLSHHNTSTPSRHITTEPLSPNSLKQNGGRKITGDSSMDRFDTEGKLTFTTTGPVPLMFQLSKLEEDPREEEICCRGGHMSSLMYGVLLGVLALTLPVADTIIDHDVLHYTTAAFLLYLYGMGIIFLLAMELWSVRQHRQRKQEVLESETPLGSLQNGYSNNAYFDDEMDGSVWPGGYSGLSNLNDLDLYIVGQHDERPKTKLPHKVTLSIRIGAIVFAMASLIYEGLMLKQFFDDDQASDCMAMYVSWPHLVLLIYILAQTYFVFKYPKFVVGQRKGLFRLGFMHMLATNLATWMMTLTLRTTDEYKQSLHRSFMQLAHNRTDNSSICSTDDGSMLYDALPYLYPMVFAYVILCSMAMFSHYQNIFTPRQHGTPEGDSSNQSQPAHQQGKIYLSSGFINCRKSHRGLFAGLVICAATCVSVILFLSYSSDDDSGDDRRILIYHISDIFLHTVLLTAVCIGIARTRRLEHAISKYNVVQLDKTLLFLVLVGAEIYRICRFIALYSALTKGKTELNVVMTMSSNALGVILDIIQAGFVLDMMSRECKTRRNKRRKPGRGTIMFLLIVNLLHFIFNYFHIEQLRLEEVETTEYERYTTMVWLTVVNAFLPVLMLYYYQCASCYVQVWSNAYVDETRKLAKKGESQRSASPVDTADEGTQVRVIELRRRVRTGPDTEEVQTVLSPCSEV